MQYRFSELDGQTLIIDVEDGDTGNLVDMLNSRGHGFAVYGEGVSIPFAVIDTRLLSEPGFTRDHLLAIEAHELGHIHQQSDNEAVAESAGIDLLVKLGEEGAAALLRSRGVV